MDPAPLQSRLKPWLYPVLLAVLVLVLVVAWLNTPHQDSTEKGLSAKEEKALLQHDKELEKEVIYWKNKAERADSASDAAYAKGLQAAKEATTLHQESRHASPVTRSASAAELQRILSNY